jgi:hypothetical protein
MTLQIIGAGLPRTGTASLGIALKRLIGGEVHHMSVIPGHPFDLGAEWDLALAGGAQDWHAVFRGYTAAVDWPSSMFWRELSLSFPGAPIVLSVRDSAMIWWESAEATFLPFARLALDPDWEHGTGLADLLARFAGTKDWNDPEVLMAAHDRHNEAVRRAAPAGRLLEWQAADGWEPLCAHLDVPVPDEPFPWVNRREDWG